MKKHNLLHIARSLSERLQKIDYDQLPISGYNKQYISNLKPAMHYYMKIYSACLSKGFDIINCSPEHATVVDYGGGSGFLSILAKSAGVGRVIYLDLNPKSVETIEILKKRQRLVRILFYMEILTHWPVGAKIMTFIRTCWLLQT